MVRNDWKCIFIHINKTAGTSVTNALGMLKVHFSVSLLFSDEIYSDEQYLVWSNKLPDHTKRSEVNWLSIETIRERWDEYYKFTVVRNPWDRVISDHFFCKRRGILTNATSPRQDIMNNFKNTQRWKLPCYDWLTRDGELAVDKICRFENLQNDFNAVCDDLGTPRVNLGHQNRSRHKHYTEYYDDESREMVAEKYKKDIEYFGYEFGE